MVIIVHLELSNFNEPIKTLLKYIVYRYTYSYSTLKCKKYGENGENAKTTNHQKSKSTTETH